MSEGFIFKSKDYLHYKAGRYVFLESHENDSKRIIMVEPNIKILYSYDVTIYRDGNDTLSEKDIIMSFKQMRVMEKSYNKTVLQDWDEDEVTCLPTTHYGLTINYKDYKIKEIFNCVISLYDTGENFVFLNDSELFDRFYPWTYDLYQHDKTGIYTERQGREGCIKWTFVKNQKQGKWQSISSNGGIEEIGNYKLGKPDGEYKELYGNGKIRHTCIYENGRINGISRYYNREGFLILEGNYLNDKQVGKWITYNNQGEFKSFEDYGEKGKPLFFKDCSGAGNFVCRECGFEQKITSHLHDLPSNLSQTTWTSGYQCQECGKFQARTSTPKKRDIDLTCECGGQIDDEKPLFCPKCKSLDVEYHITFMT
jgi:hypothetical protein